MTNLVIGCGYVGLRVAREWLAQGRRVAVVTRSKERARALQGEGFLPLVADVTDRRSLEHLPQAQTVLYAVGYDRSGTASRRTVVVDGLTHALDALSGRLERLVFISSTGVMGGHGGHWVDETAPCRPRREAGCCGLEAERILQTHDLGSRAVILRLAGIYGPGRLPKLAELLAQRPVPAPDQAYLNLIHVEDAVRVILAAESEGSTPGLYLVSDGHPTTHREFYREMARQLGLPEPEFRPPEPGSRGAEAARGSKRVRNGKLMETFGLELAFPDFRSGLAAICAGIQRPSP